MSWQLFSAEETEQFLGRVRDERFRSIFEVPFVQIRYHPLRFYRNGFLYLLENQRVEPPFTIPYIRSGSEMVCLDGGAAPFEDLNAKGCLVLQADTVLDYLDLYCMYVIQRPNNVLLLRNVENLSFPGDYYIDFHFDKHNYGDKDIEISRTSDNSGYIVQAPFIFDGKIDPAVAIISDDGRVVIERREGR